MYRFLIIIGFVSFFSMSCEKVKTYFNPNFTYIEIIDGKNTFLDNENGKLIYVGNNQIIGYLNLKEENKMRLYESFSGDGYTIDRFSTLSIRFL
jgi:hypothetical protein